MSSPEWRAETGRLARRLHRISMSVVGEKLDLYQFLAVIALHAERHASQMDQALRISDGAGSGGAAPAGSPRAPR